MSPSYTPPQGVKGAGAPAGVVVVTQTQYITLPVATPEVLTSSKELTETVSDSVVVTETSS